MKTIKLTQGKFAIVDEEDFEQLSKFKWRANKGRNTYYAVRWNERRDQLIIMHRIVIDAPLGLQVDHIDGNGLNNQKLNLRGVSCRENLQNRHHPKSSRFTGVTFDKFMKRKKRWVSHIRIDNKLKFLGYFLTEEEAHEAYLKEVELLGT